MFRLAEVELAVRTPFSLTQEPHMSLRLHSKYGVNPTIPTCFYCCKSKNMLILLGAASE